MINKDYTPPNEFTAKLETMKSNRRLYNVYSLKIIFFLVFTLIIMIEVNPCCMPFPIIRTLKRLS